MVESYSEQIELPFNFDKVMCEEFLNLRQFH